MSRIFANKITNYNNDGPVEAEKGINIPDNKPLQVGGLSGSPGQYLSTTGQGLEWKTFPNIFSGSWSDLTDKPTWLNTFSGSYTQLTNKPVIPSFSLTNVVGGQVLYYDGVNWVNTNPSQIYTYTLDKTFFNPGALVTLSTSGTASSGAASYTINSGTAGITVANISGGAAPSGPWTIVVTKAAGTYSAQVLLGGENFGLNDTITIPGNLLGGTSGTNNLVLTATEVTPPNVFAIDLVNQFDEKSSLEFVGTQGINIEYDNNNRISLSIDPDFAGYDPEQVKSDIAEMINSGTKTGITYTFRDVEDPNTGEFSKVMDSTVDLSSAQLFLNDLTDVSINPNILADRDVLVYNNIVQQWLAEPQTTSIFNTYTVETTELNSNQSFTFDFSITKKNIGISYLEAIDPQECRVVLYKDASYRDADSVRIDGIIENTLPNSSSTNVYVGSFYDNVNKKLLLLHQTNNLDAGPTTSVNRYLLSYNMDEDTNDVLNTVENVTKYYFTTSITSTYHRALTFDYNGQYAYTLGNITNTTNTTRSVYRWGLLNPSYDLSDITSNTNPTSYSNSTLLTGATDIAIADNGMHSYTIVPGTSASAFYRSPVVGTAYQISTTIGSTNLSITIPEDRNMYAFCFGGYDYVVLSSNTAYTLGTKVLFGVDLYEVVQSGTTGTIGASVSKYGTFTSGTAKLKKIAYPNNPIRGQVLYMLGGDTSSIYEYRSKIPFSKTAGSSSNPGPTNYTIRTKFELKDTYGDLLTLDPAGASISISSNGKSIFVTNNTSVVYQYKLKNAWDINSIYTQETIGDINSGIILDTELDGQTTTTLTPCQISNVSNVEQVTSIYGKIINKSGDSKIINLEIGYLEF